MFDINYLRSFRIVNFAIIDFVATFAVMLIVGPILSWLFRKISINIPLWSRIVWAVPITILAHLVFAVDTPLTAMFLNPSGDYLIKIVFVVLVVAGFYGVSLIK